MDDRRSGSRSTHAARFDARLELSPGEYRARLAPGRGFVPGVSATLRVGPA